MGSLSVGEILLEVEASLERAGAALGLAAQIRREAVAAGLEGLWRFTSGR